jgi:hypothetical protein
MFTEEETGIHLRYMSRLLQDSKDARSAVCVSVTSICILKQYHKYKKQNSELCLLKGERRVMQNIKGMQNENKIYLKNCECRYHKKLSI